MKISNLDSKLKKKFDYQNIDFFTENIQKKNLFKPDLNAEISSLVFGIAAYFHQ